MLFVRCFEPSRWAADGHLVRTTRPPVLAGLLAAAALGWGRERFRGSRAQRRLQSTEEDLRLTFDAAPIGMALVGLDGTFLRVNPSLCAIAGRSRAELIGTTFQNITHDEDLRLDLRLLEECIDGTREGYEMQKRYVHGEDGRDVWVQLHVVVARDSLGLPIHFVAQIMDVTERRAADAALAASQARFAALVEHGSDLISITDRMGGLVYASPAYQSVLGLDLATCLGEPLQDHVHPDDRPGVVAVGLALAESPGASQTLDFRYGHADGSWRWVEATLTNRLTDPAVMGFVCNTRDVTERIEAAARLAHQATHDVLTGLPNRALVQERLDRAHASEHLGAELLAAVFIDVDHFKVVNDTHGHHVGDQLLVQVAERLRGAARGDDTVARLGGDEFVIIAGVTSEAAADALAARVCTAFAEPFEVDGLVLAVTGSIGLATTHEAGGAGALLAAADCALYEAKALGRATYVAYLPHMGAADPEARRWRPDTEPTDLADAVIATS